MSTIEELQARLIAAMDRVGAGVETLSTGETQAAEVLQASLEEERTVTAQLEERLKTLKDKQAQELEGMASQLQDMRVKVDSLDLEQQRLRKANGQLREANAALREANEAGVGEPHLINKSMMAELEALRASRAADIAEASAILSALTPILNSTTDEGGAQNA